MAKKIIKKEEKKSYRKKGRPTDFTLPIKITLKELISRALTDKEICVELDIDPATMINWRKKHKKFFASLQDWRIEADLIVERTLFESCKGGIIKERKPLTVGTGDGMTTVEYHDYEKYIVPSTTAAKFWLTNRKSAEWRERREFDINEVNKLTDEELAAKVSEIMGKND